MSSASSTNSDDSGRSETYPVEALPPRGERSAVLTEPTQPRPQHILTVNLEDYFQVAAFNHLIAPDQWYRFEARLQSNTESTLKLLKELNVHATFFVKGWIAKERPELVRMVADAGHEIAVSGFYQNMAEVTEDEFREDVRRARFAVEDAVGKKVLGFRLSRGWLRPGELWAFDLLAREGYEYDSSILPRIRRFHEEEFSVIKSRETAHGPIWEVPLASTKLFGLRVPIAGGNYFRQLPSFFIRRAVRKQLDDSDTPFVMYFHVWELDPDQPRISAAGRLARVRQYRNLTRIRTMLKEFVGGRDFGPAADYLGLDREQPATVRERIESPSSPPIVRLKPTDQLTPVSIVVPCYNEEKTIPYLANTLESVTSALSSNWKPHFVLVDDKSTDTTWETLQRTFSDEERFTLVRHDVNQGVSAAIMTGIRAAESEIVCSIDCDCSYDPHELKQMIPLLGDYVAMVTASPYHPDGTVKNVPGWRLFLSKTLSWMYRVLLRKKLYTWTSCCRIYRRSAVSEIQLTKPGFLGTAELVARLCMAGSQIVEHPATLEVRIFGESKMKTFRTIFGHLGLLARIVKIKMLGNTDKASAGTTSSPAQ